MSTTGPPRTPRSPRWPWLALAIGLAWSALLRAPLIAHAADHLDSDLAVDGLVLIEAVDGKWRWHYPGTPHMGIPPVLLSIPQAAGDRTGPGGARQRGDGGVVPGDPRDVRAGVVAFSGRRRPGGRWSHWSASSVGTVWLSGRITGGHLLTLAWHAAAFAGLATCLYRGGGWRAVAARALVRLRPLHRHDDPVHDRRDRAGGDRVLVVAGTAEVGPGRGPGVRRRARGRRGAGGDRPAGRPV